MKLHLGCGEKFLKGFIHDDIDKKAIINSDRKTIPKDFKFDFKFRICFVEIIKPANIQN